MYIIASTSEQNAKDIAAAMNSYSMSKPHEMSEHREQRANRGKTWAQRTNQRQAKVA
jgi:hypothetical protein